MKKITENTLVPISLLTVIVGGVFWLSSMYSKVEAHAKSMEVVEAKQDKHIEVLQSIDKRLTRIEAKLESKRN